MTVTRDEGLTMWHLTNGLATVAAVAASRTADGVPVRPGLRVKGYDCWTGRVVRLSTVDGSSYSRAPLADRAWWDVEGDRGERGLYNGSRMVTAR